MKIQRIKKRSTMFFATVALVALFVVTSMPASQASAHHKAHTASSQVSTTVVAVHHKAHTASKGKISVHQVAVIPEMHGPTLQVNATTLKKLTKGPYGERDVIGGMTVGGEPY
jgi:hypothetical protein